MPHELRFTPPECTSPQSQKRHQSQRIHLDDGHVALDAKWKALRMRRASDSWSRGRPSARASHETSRPTYCATAMPHTCSSRGGTSTATKTRSGIQASRRPRCTPMLRGIGSRPHRCMTFSGLANLRLYSPISVNKRRLSRTFPLDSLSCKERNFVYTIVTSKPNRRHNNN